MRIRGFIVRIFAVVLIFAPQFVNSQVQRQQIFCSTDITDRRTGPLPWAKSQG